MGNHHLPLLTSELVQVDAELLRQGLDVDLPVLFWHLAQFFKQGQSLGGDLCSFHRGDRDGLFSGPGPHLRQENLQRPDLLPTPWELLRDGLQSLFVFLPVIVLKEGLRDDPKLALRELVNGEVNRYRRTRPTPEELISQLIGFPCVTSSCGLNRHDQESTG